MVRSRERSLAQQVFVLQVLIVTLLVAAATLLAYVDARRDQRETARTRSVDIAETLADSPTVRQALRSEAPSRVLQPYAEAVRADTGTDFVVVMALDRTRYTHPVADRIGQEFVGDLGGAPQGEPFTQEYTGTLGPSMRAVVPVRAPAAGQGSGSTGEGEVVALVSVGITLDRIDRQLNARLWPIGLAGLAILAVGGTGVWLISRRLRRVTHGMGSEEIARMYEYYDSVLHAVREGLVLLDERGRVQLVNDEAGRLLDLPEDRQLLIGRPVDVLALPGPLTDRLRGRSLEDDDIHLVGDRVLVVNQAAARWEGRDVGSVVTFRDHTELQAVTGELDTVRGMTDSLRALNHESANRLHTVVSLIELDRIEEAVTFATDELETVQRLTDRLVAAVDEPVVAALLLGKSATAAERGIDLVVDPESRVSGLPVEGRDLVTLLGNLLDNALEAVGRQVAPAERRIRVRVVASRSALEIAVDDSGPGVSPADVARVFERGWSTKTPGHGSAGGGSDGESGGVGRGLGLALVGQTARRYGGGVEVAVSDLGGARFVVRVPEPAPAASDAPGAPA